MVENKKEIFTPFRSVVLLLGIIILACTAHVKFFLDDGRPFIDHDGYYFISGYLGHIVFIYELIAAFLNKFFPLFAYNGFFLYKMVNLFFLIPLIVFTYLSAAFLYGRAYGLLASFFVVTAPDILNIFHKSEINFLTATIFSMLMYFYIRSNRLRNIYFSLMFICSLYVFFLHHYSSLLYMAAVGVVYFLTFCYRCKGSKKTKQHFFYIVGFCVLLITVDVFFHWERYFFYMRTAMDYIHKIFHNDLFFSSYVGESLRDKYLYSFRLLFNNYYFHFGVNLYFLSFLITSFWLGAAFIYKCIRKISFSEIEYIQLQFLCILWVCLLFLCSGIGTDVFAVFVFFAPLYGLVAVLNTGFLYRLYGRYAKIKVFKAFFIAGVVAFIVYGLFSLFSPKSLVCGSYRYGDNYFYYLPQQDDYNIPAHLAFFEEEGIDVAGREMLFLPMPDSYYTDLMDFYFSVRMRGSLQDLLSPPAVPYKYIWVAYDATKNKALGSVRQIKSRVKRAFSKKDLSYGLRKNEMAFDMLDWYRDFNAVSFLEIEKKIGLIVNKKTMSDFKKEAVLIRILPFDFELKAGYEIKGFEKLKQKYSGVLKGNVTDLEPFRKCLVFIYKVKR